MDGHLSCGVCGTVNLPGSGRCIACGQALAAPAPEDPTIPTTPPPSNPGGVWVPPGATPPLDPTLPLEPAAKPAPAPPPPATSPAAPREDDDVVVAAARRTILEPSASPPTAATSDIAPSSGGVSFVVRLLLPEGDRSVAEVGSKPVRLGSGLDELGLAGDPKVGSGEAVLRVIDGRLWVETVPDANGIYRRVEGEEMLQDGDVVLMGDVAAEFRTLPPAPAMAAEVHVLGGASASPAGRLAFLRRDGSPGPVHDLPLGKTIVGRTDGHVNFPQDSRLSRRHVRFHATEQGVTVEDLDSRNGTYVRVRGRRRLEVGDALRVGSAGVQVRSRA
jgi:hypothetical protein